MINTSVMVRVLQDIWHWPPAVEPHLRQVNKVQVFAWDWTRGRRAIQRLAFLQIHTQLLEGLRRRVTMDCSDAELTEFLQRARTTARTCAPDKVSDEAIAVQMYDDGSLSRIAVPKTYRAPKVRTESEALEEAKQLDDEEGVDESVSKRDVDPVDVSELLDE